MSKSSPQDYGSTRPPAAPKSTSSSSLSAKAMAIRAAHRFTSSSSSSDLPAPELDIVPNTSAFGSENSALSPTSLGQPSLTLNGLPTPGDGDGNGFKDPFPSPVRFLDDHRSSGPGVVGSPGTIGSDTTSKPQAHVRWRPPRKSIDAGRLARQRSHQSYGSVDTSTHSSPLLNPRSPELNSSIGGGMGGDRRKSSRLSQKPRYRWLSQPGGGTGDEPGVDVRSRRDEEAYGGLKGKTTVTIVDYANYTPREPKATGGFGGQQGQFGGQQGQGGEIEEHGIVEEEDSGEEDEGDMNFRVEFPGERLGEWLEGEGKRKVGSDGKSVGVRWSMSPLFLGCFEII